MKRTILSLAAATTVFCTTAAEAGTLYAVSEGTDVLVSIDTNTLLVTTIGPLRIPYDFGGMAYDCTADTMYLIGGRPSEQLYTVDLNTGAATPVGGPHAIEDLFGLAYDASRDTLYACQFIPDTPLWSMNRATGAGTPGPVIAESLGGLAYNALDDELVGVWDGTGDLYRIDRDTGATTLLYEGLHTNNSGLAYDCENHYFWDIDWNGDLRYYDIANGYAETLVLGGLGPHDGLAFVSDECSPCGGLCVCPEDIDRDGRVAFGDILRILGAWGDCFGCDEPGVCGDFPPCDGEGCICLTAFDGSGVCYPSGTLCGDECPDGTCPPGFICVVDTCCGPTTCLPADTGCPTDGLVAPPPGTAVIAGVIGPEGRVIAPQPDWTSLGMVSTRGPLRVAGSDVGTGRVRASDVVATMVTQGLVARAGGVIPVGQFGGDASEDWEDFENYQENPLFYEASPATIFGGAAEISNPMMAVYEPSTGATFGLDTSGSAQVADGTQGMGLDGFDSLATIVFDEPVGVFGAFWGAATGTEFGDPAAVEVRFVDETGALIDFVVLEYSRSEAADGLLVWHGWQSPVPIKAVHYLGSFVVIDGMQANFADPCLSRPCPEDVDRDGRVAFSDILRVLGAWGPCEECDDCEDGMVDRCGGTDECLECQTPVGDCLCTFGALSACEQFVTCPDGDCPPGFFCCTNTCCPEPICMPLCEGDASPAMQPAKPGALTPSGIAR